MSLQYGPAEMMAVVLARQFQNGEVVVMGAVPDLPLAACRLARALHAPHLSYIVGGSGTVNPEPPALPHSSCDPALAEGACTMPLPEIVLLEGRGDALDVFCAGGIQIDAYGNCNLVAVGEWARPTLRGPGTVGLPFLPVTGRSVIYTMDHSPRTFVDRVDFISGPGHPAERGEERSYRGRGPTIVVTPLATLDFELGRMRLASVHPGSDPDRVRESTGFELPPGTPAETPAPSAVELAALREIDADGVLGGKDR